MYWSVKGRNAAEQITSEAFGSGVATTRMYDTEYRLNSITTLNGTNPLQCIGYGHDPSDNVISRNMTQNSTCTTPQGPNPSLGIESAPVDWANQISSWSSPGSGWNITFHYDDIGNLKQQAGPLIAVPPQMDYTYGGNGAGVHAVTKITSGSTVLNYGYDQAGNQTNAPARSIRFTSFNLPSRITTGRQHPARPTSTMHLATGC